MAHILDYFLSMKIAVSSIPHEPNTQRPFRDKMGFLRTCYTLSCMVCHYQTGNVVCYLAIRWGINNSFLLKGPCLASKWE